MSAKSFRNAASLSTPDFSNKTVNVLKIPLPGPSQAERADVEVPGTFFAFSFGPRAAEMPGHGVFPVNLAPLNGPDTSGNNRVERWLAPESVRYGKQGRVSFARTHSFLVAHVRCEEVCISTVEKVTEDAYMRLLEFCQTEGFPYPCRAWNFMPDINHGDGYLDVYKCFTVGRANAFDACGLDETLYPAGTAIGSISGTPLGITVLATKARPTMISNSRQMDAFRYPSQYGPRSPSFSRAALLATEHNSCLLVSGTASVVGHESHHPADIEAQTEETCSNIRQVLRETQIPQWQSPTESLNGIFRVYLRDPHHLPIARQVLQQHFGKMPAIYLQGDICRSELMLEIEAAIWV